jgi:tetratricopeptide (TPR) repeat protein
LIEDVPFHSQDRDQCGPASLAMVLGWSGDPVTPEQIASQVYTPALKGSLQPGLVTAARRRGRVVYPVRTLEALLGEVAAGSPAVVLQNLGFWWADVWHYAVVVGYDLPSGQIVLHTGSESRKALPLRLFERTWARGERWGIVVLPPDQLPASPQEKLYLQALLGLERAQRWRAAAVAYGRAAERWPSSLGALIGLGNSRYVLGELAGAEEAFRRATDAHPRAAPAFNNLATVLAAQGRRAEALVAAERAVQLGGASASFYERTLRQIQAEARSPHAPGTR